MFDVKSVSDRKMESMQMGMREFMVMEDLEDVILRVREFFNLLLPTT